MDKKVYTSPTLSVAVFGSADVITTSGLTFGGQKGSSASESFSSVFK